MVDRLEKLDPNVYRVQETLKDRGRRNSQGEEDEESQKKDKDKFDKGKPFWKKLIPETAQKSSSLVGSPLQVRKDSLLSSGADFTHPESEAGGEIITGSLTEELSLSLSQRMLVMWGILDLKGKPKVPAIVTYGVIVSVILLSMFVIMRILWR